MKTIFRNLAFGVLLAVFAALTVTTTFAQDACTDVEANQALYKKYTDNYAGKIDQVKVAIEAAKQYIEKYGACVDAKTNAPLYADQVNYLKGALPEREKFVKDTGDKAAKTALLVKFDTAAKAKNLPDMYSSGKEILAKESDFPDVALDVTIALASAGFDQSLANPPVDTYNADTINYAKSAIQKIEAGKTSKSWGVWSYNIKNDKFTDSKSYALGALNYIVGYVTSYRQGKDSPEKKKEALSYFYKSVQYNSFSKTEPLIYQAIGAWYLDEAIRIDKERTAAIKVAGDKDTDETLAMLANQKGYADRAIDAYARAYKLAKDDKAQKKEYTDGIYTRLTELYKFRYDNKVEGIDAFVSTVMSKPLPDPTTAITPVKEEEPVTTTPTNSSTTTTTPATNSTTKPTTNTTTKPATNTNTTKPATTTTTKPVSETTTSTDSKTTATTTKTSTPKKPTPKKKGTR